MELEKNISVLLIYIFMMDRILGTFHIIVINAYFL